MVINISSGLKWVQLGDGFSETFGSFKSQGHTIIIDETSRDILIFWTCEPDPSGMATLAVDVFETPDLR